MVAAAAAGPAGAGGLFDVGSLMPGSLWSEGPTPGALQELLDNIDKRTEQLRSDLFFNLMSSLSGSADPKLLAAMGALADVSSASGTEQWVAQSANKYLEMQQYVASLQAELKAAQAAADLEATLREFKGFLENGQFNDAAYSMVQLRKILEDNNSSSQSGGKPATPELAALQQACAACERDLEEALESALAEAFDASLDGGVISISCTLPSGGDVGELWAAMQLAGMADKHLNSVADTLLNYVLPHVLTGACCLDAHMQPSGESGCIRWWGVAPGPSGAYSTEHVEGQVTALLATLAQGLFRGQAAALAGFGTAFWARFVAAYEAAFLQQVAGSSVAVLQARQEAARALEAQAVSLGLAEPGSDLARCLSRAIQESYHVVQEAYLAAARELLLGHDPHAEPVTVGQPLPLDAAFYERYKEGRVKAWEALDPPSGWDVSGPVLATGYYPISGTALQLVMLMDDALAQACHQGDTSMAQAIVGAVSKMATMWGTMLPPPSAADAPSLALLRHNDAGYIAQHLLVLPFLFDSELEPLLGVGLWFGDEALRLRNAARAAYTETVAVQVTAVGEALSPLFGLSQSLASGKAPPAKELEGTAASARKAGLYSLTRAGRLLWSTLAPATALDASQAVVEQLATRMVSDIAHRRDIGEVEARELVRLYRPLLEGLLPALLAEADMDRQGVALDGLDLKELVGQALSHRCRSLRKLAVVLDLLEARLADIVAAWESGALRDAGMSLNEVGGLVVSLFEDTDYRAQCLQRMEAAAGL